MVSSSTTPQKHLMSKISSEKEQQLKSLQVPSTEQVVAELLSRAEEIQFQAAGVQTVDLDRYREQQEEQRQKRHFLIWLNQNGNLYPSREQKERLAEQMGTSYGKVNKLFANQRRRHHKQKSIKKEENNHRLIFDNKNDKINNLKENGEDSQIINNNCVNNIDKTIENVWNKVMESDGYNNQNNDVRVPNIYHHHLQQQQQILPPQTSSTIQPISSSSHHHFSSSPSSSTISSHQNVPPPVGTVLEWLQLLEDTNGNKRSSSPFLLQQQKLILNNQQNEQQQKNTNQTIQSNPLLLAALAQAQQQQMALQQLAIMEAAIKKEIFELLSATQSQQNLALLAQRSQLLTHLGHLQREQQEQQNFISFSPEATTLLQQQQSAIPGVANGNIYCPPTVFTPPANSLTISLNGSSCDSPSSSASSASDPFQFHIQSTEEGIDFVDLDLIEKQIAAQNNRLSAAEAEAVAVLAGLAAFGDVNNINYNGGR